jgi:hypothetical protein
MRKRDRIRLKLKKLTEAQILQAMRETFDDAYNTFRRKLGDYGVDVYKASGAIGIIGRMREKFLRIDNLLKNKEAPNYESILDNLEDIAVLATTALALFRKELADMEELQEQYKMIYGEKLDEKDIAD